MTPTKLNLKRREFLQLYIRDDDGGGGCGGVDRRRAAKSENCLSHVCCCMDMSRLWGDDETRLAAHTKPFPLAVDAAPIVVAPSDAIELRSYTPF